MPHLHIAFGTDENYVQHLGCLMVSILKNAGKEDRFTFYVLNPGISEEARKKLLSLKTSTCEMELIDCSLAAMAQCPQNGHVSKSGYLRLLLPKVLPREVDRLLYLDCDMIVLGSLAELWKTELGGNLIAAVEDYSEREKTIYAPSGHLDIQHPGFNSGMLLINLQKIREERWFEQVLEWIYTHSETMLFNDQDGLNVILENHWLKLPEKWNYQIVSKVECFQNDLYPKQLWNRILPEISIIHYITANKPWKYGYEKVPGKLYLKYLKQTPWKKYKPPVPPMKERIRHALRRNPVNQKFKAFCKRVKLFLRGDKKS